MRLPLGVRCVIGFLLASPFLQLACVLLGRRFLNFGGGSWWNFFIYWLIAPMVATLLITRHERARFSLYVFLSCEAYRGIKIHSPPLLLLAVLGIVYFQRSAVLAVYPRIDPRQVRRRVAGYFGA